MAIEDTYTTTKGDTIQLRSFDVYQFALGNVAIPSQARKDVINLIAGSGGLSTDPAQIEAGNLAWIRGLYEASALVCHEPKLVLRGPVSEGALTPADLTLEDVSNLYQFFRTGRIFRPTKPTENPEPGTGTEPAPDSGGVQEGA